MVVGWWLLVVGCWLIENLDLSTNTFPFRHPFLWKGLGIGIFATDLKDFHRFYK
jgi:hypothetical protein